MSGKTTVSFEDMEKQGWSDADVASNYSTGFAQAADQSAVPLVRAIAAKKQDRVLDLCCGHGVVTQALAAAGAVPTGLDFSPAMLALATARVPGVEFLEGDALDLPFDDGAFDGVTMGFGMLHVPDGRKALSEARRVLKPGGRFAYTVWHAPTIPSGVGYVFKAVADYGDPSVQLPPGPGMFDYADPKIADPQLEEAGFGKMSYSVVESYWTAHAPDLPFHNFKEGTVRGGALLGLQPAANAEAIRLAVADTVRAEHGQAGPWKIPMPACLVSAVAV